MEEFKTKRFTQERKKYIRRNNNVTFFMITININTWLSENRGGKYDKTRKRDRGKEMKETAEVTGPQRQGKNPGS